VSSFVKQTIERAVKSAGQAVVLVLGAGQVQALTVDWQTVGGFALGAAILSVAQCDARRLPAATPGA
jgi:hypothetical protein